MAVDYQLAAEHGAVADDNLDRVRNILFGGFQNSVEGQLIELRDQLQARIGDLDRKFDEKIAVLSKELEERTETYTEGVAQLKSEVANSQLDLKETMLGAIDDAALNLSASINQLRQDNLNKGKFAELIRRLGSEILE